MRLGIISDVHSNAAGLEAVLSEMGAVDELIFAGDLLGYYFQPRRTMDRLRELRASCILGNHDVYFLAHLGLGFTGIPSVRVPSASEYREKYGPSLDIAAKELGDDERLWLQKLSTHMVLERAGVRVMVTHGSPWRPVDEYVYPDRVDFSAFRSIDADLVVMGHTHRAFVRREGSTTLLNPGSCGQPRDSDSRAAFAVVDVRDRQVQCQLGRATYDRAPVFKQCADLAPGNTLIVDLLARGDRPSEASPTPA